MKYPVKIWVCTILSAPLLLLTCGVLFSTQDPVSFLEGFIGIVLLMFLFGFMLSIPSFCLFWLIFDLLEEGVIKAYIKKITLGLTGIFLVCASFLIINNRLFDERDWSYLSFPASYSIALLFFVFFFKMPNTGNTPPR